ncbi:MAG: hypothetical protein RMK29_14350 [Myxococcales bacterium]|nr:hypothetical protein [Myxococcota bacterium]MDW8282892.1 hypothetical protein [Myxococcales bacterium]
MRRGGCTGSILRRRSRGAALALAGALVAFVGLPALHLEVHARQARLLIVRPPPAHARLLGTFAEEAPHVHPHPVPHRHGAPAPRSPHARDKDQGEDRAPHGQGAVEHLSAALLGPPALPAPLPAGPAGEEAAVPAAASTPACPPLRSHLARAPPC